MPTRRERRMKEFVVRVDQARIVIQTENMTVFHSMLTREKFSEIASELSDQYVLYYKYNLADEKPVNPPTYHYLIVLEEKDNQPPFEYPEDYTRFIK